MKWFAERGVSFDSDERAEVLHSVFGYLGIYRQETCYFNPLELEEGRGRETIERLLEMQRDDLESNVATIDVGCNAIFEEEEYEEEDDNSGDFFGNFDESEY